ncbi:MAG: serine/threonine-protein kinase PknK [Myxococcales bacterium]|nr:serine/threonine-protein kinase PknK [Myxococcales bacterium]
MITHNPVKMVLGPFRLFAPLGRGGFGEVYEGVHEGQGVPVAIKLLRGSSTDEVRALAALDHPNLLMIFDHGLVPGEERSWIATELCSGGSLGKVGPRNWNQLRRVVGDILAGLAYAHARGFLHRDLTPENVLISSIGDVRPGLKLGDFGLSIPAEFGNGRIAGTPAYMAPEQFLGDFAAHGPWTDLYAFGCLVWRLCTGEPPFGSKRPPEVLGAAHCELDLPAFQPLFPVPHGLEVLLRGLLEKAPEDRVRSAAEILSAIDAVDGEPARGVPSDWRAGTLRRQPMRLIGAGLGLHVWRPVPVIGRDVERDRLWAGLLDVRSTGGTRVVQISGLPGIGKGALAEWVCERALETGAARVTTMQAPRFNPVEALAVALSQVHPTPPAERVLALAVSAAAPSGGDGPWTVSQPGRRLGDLRRMLARVRGWGPLILHVNEPGSACLGALAALVSAGEGTGGLLLVITARSPVAWAPPACQPALETIPLGPLGPAHQVQLVEGALGLTGTLALQVREQAAGNPGFAVARVGDMLLDGVLAATDAGLVLNAGVGEAASGQTVPPVGSGSAARRGGQPAPSPGTCVFEGERARAADLRALGEHAEAALALHALAQLAFIADYWTVAEVIRDRDESLAASGRPASDPLWGEGWMWAARASAAADQPRDAAQAADRLIDAARIHGWVALLPPAFLLRAELLGLGGDPVAGQQRAREAYALCAQRGDDHGLARSAGVLGRLALHLGALGEAARWFQQAQALYTRLGNPSGAARCLLQRAEVARAAANPVLAAELLTQSRGAWQHAPEPLGEAVILLLVAGLERDAGGDGVEAARTALELAEDEGARAVAARARVAVGLGLAARQPAEALPWLFRGLREADAVGDALWAAVAAVGMLSVRADLNDPSVDLSGEIGRVRQAIVSGGGHHPDLVAGLLLAGTRACGDWRHAVRCLAMEQRSLVQK